MVRAYVETILGKFGTQILYFYEENSFVINILVLTYGFIMYASWMNIVRMYRFLVIEIAKQIHLDENLDRKSTVKSAMDNVEFPWQAAVNSSNFPLIGRISGLFPKRKTVENIQYYFYEKDLIEKAIAVLKGGNIYKMTPNFKHIIDNYIRYY